MLADHDIDWFAGELAATAEAMGQVIGENAAALMIADFRGFHKDQLREALRRVRMEGTGKLTPKALLDQLDAIAGRPGADEAWALALQARDESLTVIWTNEIEQAWAAAGVMIKGKDQVGARMAFKQAYDRIVQDARAQLKHPAPVITVGQDKGHRYRVVMEALQANRIPVEMAKTALEGCAQFEDGAFVPLLHSVQPPVIAYSSQGAPLALPPPKSIDAALSAPAPNGFVAPAVAQHIKHVLAAHAKGQRAAQRAKRRPMAVARLERMRLKHAKAQADGLVQNHLSAQQGGAL